MIPVVYSIAVKIRLADFSPIFSWIRDSVRVLPQSFIDCRAVHRIAALVPKRIDRAQRTINRVTKLVNRDTLVVIPIDWQAEQIFLTKTGRLSSCAANTFVLIRRI